MHYSWLCPQTLTARKGVEGGNKSGVDAVDKNNDSEDDSMSESDYESNDSMSECDVNVNIENVSIGMRQTTVKSSSTPSNSVLPTLKADIQGVSARCLLDSGSQRHFISVKLFREAKLKVGKAVEIKVEGLNSSKKYKTHEVKVPIKFGGKIHNIDAIILPKISTRFAADGVGSLAAGFLSRGYTLADLDLLNDRNIVENLDIVIGINATFSFMNKVVSFGKEDQSQYLDTPGGVVPIGHSLTGYANLQFLPAMQTKIENPVKQKPDYDKLNPENDKNKVLSTKSLPNQPKVINKSNLCNKKVDKSKQASKVSTSKTFKEVKKVTKSQGKKVKFKSPVADVVTDSKVTTPGMVNFEGILRKVCAAPEGVSDGMPESGDSTEISLGQSFLNSLTPGHVKDDLCANYNSYESITDEELDELLAEAIGYDFYQLGT